VGLERGGPAATVAYVTLAARAVAALGDRVEVVHAHQLLSPASAAALSLALRGPPFVATAHASGPVGDVASLARQGPLGWARLQALRHLASAFVAVSDPIRGELEAAGVPASLVRSIPNGVDTRRFVPADPADRRRLRRALGLPPVPAVLYAGRLAPEKGVDVLVDGWAEARRRGVVGTLCLVGDGPERAALERRTRDHGILGAVRFAGPTDDVAPWLAAAEAFVLPSRTEGLSLALLEAMAAGLPVIATDVGGTRDAAGGAAVLVPPDDPRALAEALAAILEAPEQATVLGEAARRRVLSRFGIQLVARRHLPVELQVAAARRATGGGHAGWAADRVRGVLVPGDHRDVRPRRAP